MGATARPVRMTEGSDGRARSERGKPSPEQAKGESRESAAQHTGTSEMPSRSRAQTKTINQPSPVQSSVRRLFPFLLIILASQASAQSNSLFNTVRTDVII